MRSSSPASTPGAPRGRNCSSAAGRTQSAGCSLTSAKSASASESEAEGSENDSQARGSVITPRPKHGQHALTNSQSVVLDLATLTPLFTLPLWEASGSLRRSVRAEQSACRKLGIQTWPRRQTLPAESAKQIFVSGAQHTRGDSLAADLAREYGISATQVRAIWRRQQWQDTTRHIFKALSELPLYSKYTMALTFENCV